MGGVGWRYMMFGSLAGSVTAARDLGGECRATQILARYWAEKAGRGQRVRRRGKAGDSNPPVDGATQVRK